MRPGLFFLKHLCYKLLFERVWMTPPLSAAAHMSRDKQLVLVAKGEGDVGVNRARAPYHDGLEPCARRGARIDTSRRLQQRVAETFLRRQLLLVVPNSVNRMQVRAKATRLEVLSALFSVKKQ